MRSIARTTSASERDVALKMLSEDLAADRHRLRRFEQEARAASMLSHPNIVTVFEIGEAQAGVYIAMELIEGQTLRHLLKPGGLPVRKLLDLAAQIAEGLACAHQAGIVHRDLKPDNVMVTAEGLAKILDFGLAKLTRSPLERGAAPDEGTLPLPTQPGVLIGTVRYMSPEQAGGSNAGFRSDQFAFGSMLYEMATGLPAFERHTTVDTLAAILHDEPEPIASSNPRVPAPLRWIIERCLAKDARNRYASTEDLARDLTLLRGHLSDLSSQPPGLAAAPRRRGVGRLAAVAAVLALGLLGGLAVNLGRGRSEPPRFHQLTFRNGHVESARFALDGQTVVYSAYWDGRPIEIFLGRSEGPEFRPVGMPGADILAVSKSGEMALSLNRRWFEPFKLIGTLARLGIASSGAPREVLEDVFWADWSPDGRDLAIVRQIGGKSRLEYPIGKVLDEEKAGYISHPRVSRDGKRVAFLDHPAVADDAGGVAVVDRAGNRKTLVTGFAAVWGLAWSPDGSEVWFTGAPTGIARALYAVDLSGRQRVLARVAGSIRLDDVAASGRVLLTHEHIKQRLMALAPGETRERDLSWLDYSLAEAISPDGREVLFVEGGEGGGPGYSAFLRRTDGSPAIRLGEGDAAQPVAGSPMGSGHRRDGGRAAVRAVPDRRRRAQAASQRTPTGHRRGLHAGRKAHPLLGARTGPRRPPLPPGPRRRNAARHLAGGLPGVRRRHLAGRQVRHGASGLATASISIPSRAASRESFRRSPRTTPPAAGPPTGATSTPSEREAGPGRWTESRWRPASANPGRS